MTAYESRGDNTEQAFSHSFLSTHAQHFFNMNVNDANIQRSRLCMNKVKTDQGPWIKDLLYMAIKGTFS